MDLLSKKKHSMNNLLNNKEIFNNMDYTIDKTKFHYLIKNLTKDTEYIK